MSSPAAIEILLVLFGAGLLLLVPILLRVVPRFQNSRRATKPPAPAVNLPPHQEAVLLVQSGGRVLYLNEAARQMFNLWEEEPNLERLARRARPGETFLGLCAAEGQARFSLNGRAIEATSYFTPYGSERAMLVSLRRPQWSLGSGLAGAALAASSGPAVAETGDLSSQAFTIISELSQAITASLDLEATLLAILEGVERLIPFDVSEITIWDPETQALTPYRLAGASGVDRPLEKASERYRPGEGYSGYLVTHRKPLLVANVDTFREARPVIDRNRVPFHSYLGVHLQVAGDLIGTLELGALSPNTFSQNDLEMLHILAGQAAVAVHNALLYKAEQQRAKELAGLADLSKGINTLRDPQDLFNRLLESISPLVAVEILGFLLYDENRRVLEAQTPFQGLPKDISEWYQTPIPADSPAEKIWQQGETVVASDATTDPRLNDLGLHHLAQVASLKGTVLQPLSSGGRSLGYLQAANKRDGSPFDQNDLRLLAIIAGQAAPIIDNLALMHQSRRRAQRAETLRRIASLTSSAATLDEILKYSVIDLARLLQADLAAIFLLDDSRGELRLHRASLFGVEAESVAHLSRIPTDDPQFPRTVTGSQSQFASGNLQEEVILPVYKPIIEALKIQSAIDVPLISRERGIGEIMLGSFKAGFFSRGDVLSAATAAGQLAAAIEQASLYSQTDQSLRQRVEQMMAITRISREINSTLDLEHVLERVHAELIRTTRADCGSILLFALADAPGGEAKNNLPNPEILLHLGDEPLPELHPLERRVLTHGEAVIVDDFATQVEVTDQGANSAETTAPPTDSIQAAVAPAHEGVRSALIVPVAYQGQIAGLIHLHSHAAGHFDAGSREVAESLAIQAAIALGNAHRYQEQVKRSEQLNRRVETLSTLFETAQTLQVERPLDQAMEAIAYAIQASTPFDVVLVSVYQESSASLERVASAGVPLAVMHELRSHLQPWASLQQLLEPQFRHGRCYLIPAEKSPVIPVDIHLVTVMSGTTAGSNGRAWHPDDLLLLPLFASTGQPLGMISVDAPRNSLRPDRTSLETLEIFGSQAALVIESQQKLTLLRSQVTSIENDLMRAQQSAQAAQGHLPTLPQKDLDQTLAIQRLSQRAERIGAGLAIAEIVNHQATTGEVLLALGREILTRMGLETALVAEASPSGPRLLHTLGNLPVGVNPEALLGQRNPLRQCLQNGETLLVSDLNESEDWQNAPVLHALETKAFICLPITVENRVNRQDKNGEKHASQESRVTAAVLAISRGTLAPFTAEDIQLFSLIARQTAIALQNLSLLNEIQRRLREVNLLMSFSRQLGSLDPASILQTLVESALQVLPMADAGMVALWDAKRQVLVPQAASGYTHTGRYLEITFRAGEGLPGQVFVKGEALRLVEVDLARHYNLAPENLLRYRDATAGRSPVSSLALPIGGAGGKAGAPQEPLGVLVLDNFKTPGAFTAGDLALITSLAQQTALTLENAGLYQASEQRARQLQSLNDVATTITSSLQTGELIATLLDQLEAILPYDTGTLWLREDISTAPGAASSNRMVVRAARGFDDSEQRLGLVVSIEDSRLLNEMISTGRSISVADVRTDPRFPSLMEYERLSWLGVPLVASGKVIGVIALEKSEPAFYGPDHIQMATTYAGQAAVGLENASLFEESQRRARELDERSQRLGMLNRLSKELSSSLDEKRILESSLNNLAEAIHCSAVSAILFDEQGEAVLQAEQPAISGELPCVLPDAPLFEHLRQSLGIFSREDVTEEAEVAPLASFLDRHHTRSLLAISISSASGAEEENRLYGLMLVHSDQVYRFEVDEVELARTIGNQVSIALQNARLFAETRSLTEDLEQRVQARTAELAREHQRTETLLRIITELSSSLDLDQVLHRTLHVLNNMIDAEQITVMIARPGEKKLHRLASVGYTEPPEDGGQPTPFAVDQGLAGWVFSHRQAALIDDVLRDPRWVPVENGITPGDSPESATCHRSALAVPLMIGAEALGTLLLFHRRVAHFSIDQLDLVQAAANQVAVAVNNAELYRLIRDQAEDLGSMLRSQQVETSRSRAILEAVADGVLVTDANKQITLFNASAEKILSLERSQVLGNSLDYFAGLFGRSAQAWRETIATWSRDPNSYQPGDTFTVQITLENGRVVAVRLAPVRLRNDFLGTVSIFQDITHQVEVNRLKSEFVATVSHELRTPMTSIKGYVEVLLMGAAGPLSSQQVHFLEIVKTNTERLAVLVNDLLDISRIESGKAALSLQPLNLDEVANEALADLERRSHEENRLVHIEKQVAAGLPRVLGDYERVRQIIDNLLDNAYHYNLPDGCITLRMQPVDDQVQVDVKDTGMGVPLQEQGRIFERFFRGENPLVLGVSGTGLGLSIVQNLVHMHHGRIWLESEGVAGEGSTFSFTLPVYRPAEG